MRRSAAVSGAVRSRFPRLSNQPVVFYNAGFPLAALPGPPALCAAFGSVDGKFEIQSPRSPVMATPTAVAAYLLLFVVVGFSFLFANLLLGKFCRPRAPNSEKLEVYECGEPTIGSSFVQFDLRFYVVALLFIIFDVEVAFFFPWATVFGKSTQMMDPNFAVVTASAAGHGANVELTPGAVGLYRELGVNRPTVPQPTVPPPPPTATPIAKAQANQPLAAGGNGQAALAQADEAIRSDAATLARISMIDIGAFFAVLLVGFAYVWRRGDLDWVRAVSKERSIGAEPTEPPAALERQSVISA